METADDLKDWGRLFLNAEHWEVPPPAWAISREKESEEYRSWLEEEQKRLEEKGEEESKESSEAAASPLEEKELKNKEEKTEESLESVPTSPLDPNWGKGLPAPTPVVAAPFTPMWRPWEEKDVVVNLSAAMQKRKRRSPAAEARSRQRLLQWQEKRDRHRLQSELRTTPIRSIKTTKTRLIKRLDVQSEDVVNSGVEGDGVVEKTVFASNGTKPIMLPQFLKSSMSSFVPETSSPSRSSCSGCRLDVPTTPTPRGPT